MATDIKLNSGVSGDRVTVEAAALDVEASDVIVDCKARRKPGGGQWRRALVHGPSDELTINMAGDYSGGVNIINASINLKVVEQHGVDPQLPKSGSPGDLILIHNFESSNANPAFQTVEYLYSLWVCVGQVHHGLGASWVKIPLGGPELGTI